jgi:uncharacterized repeat protein (TIGR01451 family)
MADQAFAEVRTDNSRKHRVIECESDKPTIGRKYFMKNTMRQRLTLSAGNASHQPRMIGRGLFVALLCAASLFGCSADSNDTGKDSGNDNNVDTNMSSTRGALNVSVTPGTASVVVTGPGSYTESFDGNNLLIDLAPGQYIATASSPAFGDSEAEINVVAGQTSSIIMVLQATPVVTTAPHTVYRDAKGNLIPLDSADLQSGKVVFYAWLDDESSGINPSKLMDTVVSDPGRPSAAEQDESAPSYTQNLAGAWVGFKDPKGVVRPVIGADVRWEIDQWWSDKVASMQFGTSDDNRTALNFGVFDDQADTRTNNGSLSAEFYPLVATEYPLYNQSGVGTPFTDGFTWVTLFSPDAKAEGRIVAVATIDGTEIGKQILYKTFSPVPELTITKKVSKDLINLDEENTVTWTVTIKNIGDDDAANVDLNDLLVSGNAASYTLATLPEAGTAVGDDGFATSFPLESQFAVAPGNTMILTFTATVTEAGTYCNEAEITEYSNKTDTWNPTDLNAQACFTAIESNVSIIKDFVAADETTSLGDALTVAADEPALLRVRVINAGSGDATEVAVNDVLTSGEAANYELIEVSSGTPNSDDGFDTDIGVLAAGETTTLIFKVKASTDGKYCDTATVTAAPGTTLGIDHDSACLNVSTPELTITKVNAPESVFPGANYTSTIVVKNIGSATAKDVLVADVLGLNPDGNVRVIYVSSSMGGMAGTLDNNTVSTTDTVSIRPDESITFTIVSRIPLGAIAGTYCDTATVTSSNTDGAEASDCVDVPSFSALQTQFVDLQDPVAVGGNFSYFSVLFVEPLSNEGVDANKLKYSFGIESPDDIGKAGDFKVTSTQVYLDTAPIRDSITGVVISDASNPTAKLLSATTDYTIDNSTEGLQLLNMSKGVVLMPGTAFYVVHAMNVPSGTAPNTMYTSSYIWNSKGTTDSTHVYETSSSEPTTVLP